MAEILLCNQPTKLTELEVKLGILPTSLLALGQQANSPLVRSHHPYLIANNPTIDERQLLTQLGTGETTRNLTSITLAYGPENTVGLAHLMHEVKEQMERHELALGTTGASMDAYKIRSEKFVEAVGEYQKALLHYRNVYKTNPSSRMLAQQRVSRAFSELQGKFRYELKSVTRNIKARKGLPLTNEERAINIAKSSRNIAKLELTNQVEASRVIRLAKTTKIIGNGLAVVDFGVRASNVYDSYKEGKNWERDLFVESSSFALSTSAASIVLDSGMAALGFVMMVTPVGWIGLLIGGAVIGAAAFTGYEVNKVTKENSGGLYDYIMRILG
jgi:hypothetical protein